MDSDTTVLVRRGRAHGGSMDQGGFSHLSIAQEAHIPIIRDQGQTHQLAWFRFQVKG